MLWFKSAVDFLFKPLAIILVAGSITAACGFSPVYRQDAQRTIRQNMALIVIAPIGGQRGLQLRNRLTEKISPTGVVDVPEFRLSVSLASSTEAVLIQLDTTATRQNLRMRASFTLTNLASGATVFTGKSVSVSSYNVVDSEFATIVAEDNATDRVAREIGEEIFDLLVVYFDRSES